MKQRQVIISLAVALATFLPALRTDAQERFFPDEVTNEYLRGFDLNESKDFINAFAALKEANDMMERHIKKTGTSVAALPESDFMFPYWAVKKSLGEVAYKLGLHEYMAAANDTLFNIIENRTFANENNYAACLAETGRMAGNMHFLKGNSNEAESYLQLALNVGKADFDFADAVRDDLAQVYYRQARYDKALAQLDTILSGRRFGDMARVRGDESARLEIVSQKALCLARLGKYGEAYDMMEPVVKRLRKSGDRKGLAEALRKSAKILMLRYDATGLYDSRADDMYREYMGMAKTYIDNNFASMSESEREQYWLAEQPFATDCYALADKDAPLAYDAALFSKAVLLQMGRVLRKDMSAGQRAKALSSIRTTWQKVKASLPQSAAAIEFVTYERKGLERIGAVVLNKAAKQPVFADIAAKDSLLAMPLADGNTLGDILTTSENDGKSLIYRNKALPGMIWNAALVNAIGNARKIYFAADNILHILAIEYLLPDRLSGRSFYRMTSTRLLTERHTAMRSDRMLLCGGVDYKTRHEVAQTEPNDQLAYYKMASYGIGLSYLQGSRSEVDSIAMLRNNPNDSTLYDLEATEGRIRQLMAAYPIVHIATHGYFADSERAGTELIPASTDRQLSYSCLFLAGAETNMGNGDFNPRQLDGILSARELASMDMSGVSLVVLSACQSGLGYMTTDGIYGLQRGIKAAGAKAIIASLWNVDDQATMYFMRTMYGLLGKGMTLHDAFSQARKQLQQTITRNVYRRAKLPDIVVERKYDDPRYSDAFILIDGYE